MEKQLMECFTHFQLVDLIGFANILQVPEEENFEDYVVNIVEAFDKKPRRIRKELVKLAKQVRDNNIEYDKEMAAKKCNPDSE